MIRSLGSADRVVFGRPQGRTVFALAFLSIVLGVASALGLLGGTVAVPVLGLMGCSYAHCYLANMKPDRAVLVPMGASLIAIAWGTSTHALVSGSWLNLAALGHDSVTGPSVLVQGHAPIAAISMVAVSVAAAAWRHSLPPMAPGPAGKYLVRAESLLAATTVVSICWGPPVGALVHGPADVRALIAAGLSVAVTVLVLAFVHFFGSIPLIGRWLVQRMGSLAGSSAVVTLIALFISSSWQ